MDWENEVKRIVAKNLKNQRLAVRKGWLERAIEQKSANLTVGVANSQLMTYDQLDKQLLAALNSNSKN